MEKLDLLMCEDCHRLYSPEKYDGLNCECGGKLQEIELDISNNSAH